MTIRNELLEILSRLQYDYPFIVEEVLASLHKHGKSQTLDLHRPLDRGVLAFLFWDALSRQGNFRNPHEIAYLFNIDNSSLQRAERELNISPLFSPSSASVERVCAELSLAYFPFVELVKKIILSLDHLMHKPETILGGIIYYLHETSMEMYPELFPIEELEDKPNRILSRFVSTILDEKFTASLSNYFNVPIKPISKIKDFIPFHDRLLYEHELKKIWKDRIMTLRTKKKKKKKKKKEKEEKEEKKKNYESE